MTQPKILHILQCTNLAGMEQSTLEMMSAFRDLGCDSRLVSLNPIGGLGPLLRQRGVPAVGLAYRRPAGIPSIPAMAREFRRNDLDAVVMSGHNLAAFAALAGIPCKHRLLFMHFHHQGVKPDWQWRLIYKTGMRIFDRIAFCADYIRAEAEELYPPLRAVSLTRPDSYRLPTVPSHQERMAARAALGLAEDTAVVGNAGWLIQRKRWDVFLRTAAKIAQQRKDVVFLACGDGPLRDELKDQSRALGLEDRVRWLGWRQDLTPFFLSLDVLLFNSDWDALPRTPLEAGSYEIPTVASALHGGLKEFISDDSIGYLTDQHDEEWLADRTLRLLNDTALRKMMGKACREVLAERHDPTRNAIETLGLLGLHLPSNQNTLPDYDACRLARQ